MNNGKFSAFGVCPRIPIRLMMAIFALPILVLTTALSNLIAPVSVNCDVRVGIVLVSRKAHCVRASLFKSPILPSGKDP